MVRRSVGDELKMTRPFRSRGQEAGLALLRTAHILRRRVDAAVAGEGLTLQQYNVLRILRGARGPLPTMEISDRMIETSCGITRLITTLEEKRLIRREQWPADRRQILCQITPAGLRVLERLDDTVDTLDESLTAALSGRQIDTLIELLDRIRATAEEAETPD